MGEEGFEEFWKLYPKKLAKGDARKAWQQTARIRPPLPELLQAVRAARASKQWQRDDGEYIPYPATWLRAERWADEYEVDLSTTPKPCAYCAAAAVGKVNGIDHCRAHGEKAMNGERSNVVAMRAA